MEGTIEASISKLRPKSRVEATGQQREVAEWARVRFLKIAQV